MKAVDIKLQNCYTQTGIDKDPVIQWCFSQKDIGKKQYAYRVVIEAEQKICHDTGEIISNEQNSICIPAVLKSHTKYNIKVQITDEAGEKEWSASSSFITGICDMKDWRGSWISNLTAKPFYTGKNFQVNQKIREVYLSVSGVGQFFAILNGEKISDYVLEGSWTDFNQHIHYYTYDVTSMMKSGSNDLVIEIANGWYIADTSEDRHFYTLNQGYQPYGRYLCGIAHLTIRYEDGTEEIVGTDESWWTEKSPTILANVYGSEDYDARMENSYEELCQKEHTQYACILNEEEQPKGGLIPILYPPVIIKKKYEAISVRELDDGQYLFDLGQNMSGLFEISVKGKAGSSVKITSFEKLDKNGNPIMTVNTWCRYTLKGTGNAEIWRPKFSYAAGRWILVQGVTIEENHEERPCIIQVNGYFITSSAEDTGIFQSSDSRYDQIHNIILKAVESNINHIHSDCPSIEKLGWQEINHLLAESIMYLKNIDTLWDKISLDIRDSQYKEGEYDMDKGTFPHRYGPGLIPSVAPRYSKFIVDYGDGSFWDIIPWGSSVLLAPFHQKHFFNNNRTMEKNYLTAKRYIDYLYEKYNGYEKIYQKETGKEKFLRHGLGDWGTCRPGEEGRENVETAFLYMDLKILSDYAKISGREEDGAYYGKLASEVKALYNENLLVQDEQTKDWYYRTFDTGSMLQTNQAIPLYFKMVPDELVESVKTSFLKTVAEHRIYTGEVGLKYVFMMLSEYGRYDIVHDMIMQPEHPSYIRFLEKGETTLPEFWEDDARSRNHDMMGHIIQWFYMEIGGISSEDGFRTIKIAPHLVKDMTWIACTYKGITGQICVKYKKENLRFHLEVEIPVNTKAYVQLPRGICSCNGENILVEEAPYMIEGGCYSFQWEEDSCGDSM